jgi:hypothetical protein
MSGIWPKNDFMLRGEIEPRTFLLGVDQPLFLPCPCTSSSEEPQELV